MTDNNDNGSTSKRASRREAKRLAKEFADAQAAVPALDDALETMLIGYRVNDVTDAEWATIRPVLIDVMRRSHIEGVSSFRKHLGVVAKYLAYQHHAGVKLETALTATRIDHYYLHGMPGASTKTRNDYRSRLLKIAEHVASGVDAPVRAPSLGHRSVRPGYSPTEVAQLRRVALRQRSPLRRRQMCAIVGLAIGAGLSSTDLRFVHVHDIRDLGDDGIEITVSGPAARVVWVRREFEDLVRLGIDGLTPDQLVIGEQIDRRNITTGIFARVESFDGPELDASRMRSTWLSWLIVQRVPIQVILRASGLKTARTVTELIGYLDEPSDDAVAIMRGEDR